MGSMFSISRKFTITISFEDEVAPIICIHRISHNKISIVTSKTTVIRGLGAEKFSADNYLVDYLITILEKRDKHIYASLVISSDFSKQTIPFSRKELIRHLQFFEKGNIDNARRTNNR